MPRPKDGPSGVGYTSPAEPKYEYDTFYRKKILSINIIILLRYNY